MSKHCSRCGTDKPESDFASHRWCRKCQAEYRVKWLRGEREPRPPKEVIVCCKCGVTGDEHFSPSIVKKRRNGYCRKCMYQYYKNKRNADGTLYVERYQRRLAARKRKYVLDKRVEAGCSVCGEKHPACLEWHHVDPAIKKNTITGLCAENASWERIDAELAKCIVFCSNCHRKHHWKDRLKYVGKHTQTA